MADTTPVPTHLGLIFDDNRRWVPGHDRTVLEGHRRGCALDVQRQWRLEN